MSVPGPVRRAAFAVADSVVLVAHGACRQGHAAEQVQPFGACTVGTTTVTNVMGARHRRPVTPAKWQFPGDQVILAERGTNPGPPRRPFEYATLASGPEFATVQIDAEVRNDEPVTRNDRVVTSGTVRELGHIHGINRAVRWNAATAVNSGEADCRPARHRPSATPSGTGSGCGTAWRPARSPAPATMPSTAGPTGTRCPADPARTRSSRRARSAEPHHRRPLARSLSAATARSW
jgi:hypothetical protein